MFDIEIVLLEGLLKSTSNLRTPIFPAPRPIRRVQGLNPASLSFLFTTLPRQKIFLPDLLHTIDYFCQRLPFKPNLCQIIKAAFFIGSSQTL